MKSMKSSKKQPKTRKMV